MLDSRRYMALSLCPLMPSLFHSVGELNISETNWAEVQQFLYVS